MKINNHRLTLEEQYIIKKLYTPVLSRDRQAFRRLIGYIRNGIIKIKK